MKWFIFAVIATLLGVIVWRLLPQSMAPFPLIDPDRFFSVLPNAPKRATSQVGDSQYFGEFGYLKGENGARISIAIWTKRPMSEDNPYDVDLNVRVICAPSAGEAAAGLEKEISQDKRSFKKSVQIPLEGLEADQALVMRVDPAMNLYTVKTRYGNYLFLYAAQIAHGGYFETESQLLAQLRALDAHISKVLREATQLHAQEGRR